MRVLVSIGMFFSLSSFAADKYMCDVVNANPPLTMAAQVVIEPRFPVLNLISLDEEGPRMLIDQNWFNLYGSQAYNPMHRVPTCQVSHDESGSKLHTGFYCLPEDDSYCVVGKIDAHLDFDTEKKSGEFRGEAFGQLYGWPDYAFSLTFNNCQEYN